MTHYTIQAKLGISSAQHDMEREILATRTSERRNLLTDVNILLLTAMEKLREIEQLDAPQQMQFEDESAVCQVPPSGWVCTRKSGHGGPCAAWPI